MSLRERTAACRELGFRTYHVYLDSGFWRQLRKRVLERDDHACRSCGDRATQVHHVSYARDVILGKNIEPLVSICRACHEAVEFDRHGKKRPFRKKARVWRVMDRRKKEVLAILEESRNLENDQHQHLRAIMNG